MTTTTQPANAQTIRSLRQQGNLREAYQLARQLLLAEPDNVWNRRALAWVYVDLLKEAATQPTVDRLLRGLRLCQELAMDANETTWQEQVLWAVNRFLLRTPADQLPLRDLAGLVGLSSVFLGNEPSLVRSVWLKGLLRHSATGIDWMGVMNQWGWDHFRAEDMAAETLPDGKTIGPLAERVYMAVARQLIEQVPILEATVRPVIERINQLLSQYHDFSFLPYYQARLLYLMDERAEALAVFLPFARKKQHEYWVWDTLSELIDGTPDEVIGCLVKGVSLSTPDSFLVKIRQKLADRLIQQHRWSEAKGEIDRLVAARQQAGWKLPVMVQEWMNDEHYTQAIAPPTDWYADWLTVGEGLLFADKTDVVGLITGLDTDRQMAEITVNAQTVGRFPYRRFGLTPQVGDRLAIRFGVEPHNGKSRLRIYTARPTDDAPSHVTVREVQGVLRLNDKGFGHVGGSAGTSIFVPVPLLAGNRQWADQLVTVSACESWDFGKQVMGWKAFFIRRI